MTETRSLLVQALAEHGPVEVKPLSRIQALSAKATTRNWNSIPHVTHNDRFDVTDLETARKRLNAARPEAPRLTPLPFLIKATAIALQRNPQFNAAFDEEAASLVLRGYVNIGIIIDSPKGLLVGVIKDCANKDVDTIGAEAHALAEKARAKGLTIADMTGGCFTISSLGALGGTSFTPIINGAEAGILGVSRMEDAPARGPDDALVWRKMLPVSLSYDHRIVNGMDAGRLLADIDAELQNLARA